MYSRTQNETEHFNSRCLYCFITIASDVATTRELDRLEATHLCPEKALAQMLAREKSCQLPAQDR